MTPDDPRHGTYAGALQHWRTGEKACEECLVGARRADKQRDLAHLRGEPPMVELGNDAYRIVTTAPRNQLRLATGMTTHRLRAYELRGPTMLVRRSTRERILGYQQRWTPLGIQRRLQALTVLGWSMKSISDVTGINLGSLCRLRRNPDIKFVRATIAEAILGVWDRLQDSPAPECRSSIETRIEGLRRGWLPPIEWDDIDLGVAYLDATPLSDRAVDQVVVQRILGGDYTLAANNAERTEVVRQWAQAGRSLSDLGRLTGWKSERYYRISDEEAA